jgi:hypothetical protein
MKPGPLIYAVACSVAVLYVLIANVRGYVPFTSTSAASRSSGAGGHAGGTAGYFHK